MTGVGEALAVTEAVDSTGSTAELRLDRAFEDEFAPLYRAGYRVAYRLSGSREDAADCAQEACARAYTDWKRLIRRGDVTPWVIRVSGNLAIDKWRKVQRARIVLYAADGMQDVDIAARLHCSADCVAKWRRSFSEQRLDGLADKPRAGRPRRFPPGAGGRGQGGRVRAADPLRAAAVAVLAR